MNDFVVTVDSNFIIKRIDTESRLKRYVRLNFNIRYNYLNCYLITDEIISNHSECVINKIDMKRFVIRIMDLINCMHPKSKLILYVDNGSFSKNDVIFFTKDILSEENEFNFFLPEDGFLEYELR